jgi:KDO2-lipid IV(A) lauroyltransferase
MTGNANNSTEPPMPSLFNRVEYAIFSSLRWLFGRLTIPQAASISAFFWRMIAPHLRRHQRAEKNLIAAMPNLGDIERQSLLNRMWDNLGRTTAEAFRLNEIADNPSSLIVQFSPEVLAIMNNAAPAVFISLHYGNWEVTALAAERFDKPLLGIYKKVDNPLVDNAVLKMRSRFYKGGMLSRSPATIRRVSQAIREGYSIAIMADLRDSHGEFVPFFGIPSRSTQFPALLSRLYDLPIVAIKAVRTAPGQFKICAEKLDLIQSHDRRADIIENTARIQLQIEKWIKEDPALWMWGHRRWNEESFH